MIFGFRYCEPTPGAKAMLRENLIISLKHDLISSPYARDVNKPLVL